MMQIEEALRRLQTPFYVFDTDAPAARARTLRKQLPARVKLCYAMKANPFLLRGLEGAVDGFEVCSPGELRICRRAGVDMGKVVLSGIYKAPADIEDTLEEYGTRMTYTAESLRQWTLLAAGAERLGVKVPVLLRLTMGNQFGLDPELIRKILSKPHPWVEVRGIQFFSGTQKKAPGRILRELRELDDFLDELEKACGYRPQLLEYGPGLPVCYFEGEKDAAPELVAALCEGLEQMRYQGAVALELGRWLAACSGTYVTRIVDVKTNLGRPYCIVDGGIHQLNYYGQMLATKRPPVDVLPRRAGEPVPYTVCGALCTANDVLFKEYPLADPQVGDVLVFRLAGAYSPMEGMLLFLSRDLPQVALCSEAAGLRLVREAIPTDPFNSAVNE